MIERSVTRVRQLRYRASDPRGKAVAAALLALVVFGLLVLRASRWYENQLLVERRSEAALDVALQSNALSAAINRRLARLQGLHSFVLAELNEFEVLETPEILPEFDTFAADLFASSRGIGNMTVAPRGIVRYVYPPQGNESIVGYEPLKDPQPEIRADAQRAIESRQVVVSQPIQSIEGDLRINAHQAVYQDNEFWGLVNVVIDLPTLFDEAELDTAASDLDLALRDKKGRVFYGAHDVFAGDPVISRVDIPADIWELAGVPNEGWQSANRAPMLVFEVAGFIIVGLLVGLTYLSVNRQARLSAAVRQRTQALEQDIAARKQVEAVLSEREAQYREIFESTSDGLFINDLDGRLIDFNPAAAHMHGYSLEEFRRLQPAEFVHTDSLFVFSKYIEMVKAGKKFRGRAVDFRKDGTLFPIEVLGTGFTYHGIPHALAVVRDITEEVQAVELLEQRVAERTQELTTLLELSNQLASTLEMAPLVELILEQLKRVIDYSGATVLILEGDELQAAGHHGPVQPDTITQLRLPLEEVKEFWAAMLRREPLVVDDVQAQTPEAESYRQVTRAYPAAATSYVRSWMGIPLMVQERLVGALSINHRQPNAYIARHAALALTIANQAAIAIENASLYEQAWRLAVLEERQRLARELHDSVSQALYGIGMGASTAREHLDRDPPKAAEPLDYVISLTDAGLAEMRALIFELRPDSLEKEGLVAALQKQVAALCARHKLAVRTTFGDEPAISFEAKETLYRVAQEALNNTVKHARASQVEIRLDAGDEEVILEVEDDGIGFDPQATYPGHLGLQTMRERVAKLRGTLELSSAPGTGTVVRVAIAGPKRTQASSRHPATGPPAKYL